MNTIVKTSALAGAIATIVIFFTESFSSLEIPAAVASAVTVVTSAVIGYVTPSSDDGELDSGDDEVPERFS